MRLKSGDAVDSFWLGKRDPGPNASLVYEARFELAGSASLERNVTYVNPESIVRIALWIL
jgi:hypothetical protein